jgi:eukaryotic-like serine/threonine-protein kinase
MSSAPKVSATRLQVVEEVFHAALEQEPQQLGAFLDMACAGNWTLRGEVEALLAAHQEAGAFIETPVVTVDSNIFENGQAGRLVGQVIGQYRIVKPIGIGGMGVVYLARRADRQYEKFVAIKLIKRGMDTDSVLRHFRNERQILAGFDHANIARLLDGGTTESGLPYFVMEYVEGIPIDEYCDTHALSITGRLKLLREVCSAVSYAHRHAVIHRDIKPSNILVSSDGVPKLLDFGIAKILRPDGDAESVATMTGLRLMTPEYASPEQVRGLPLTTASDVYSLGVVLYRLLTGMLPYRMPSQSILDIARAIIELEPQKPSSVVMRALVENSSFVVGSGHQSAGRRLRRRLRGDLDNVVLMALRKEPDRRYQSVEQLSEDIRRHLESLPVVARKDTLTYRSAKFMRRNKATTIAASLVFLTLLGGIVATWWQAHRARAQEAFAQAEKARAERRFNDVRRLANSVLFDYHDAIKDLSGATAVRERLVRDGLSYLDSLAGEAGDDPALQRELAAAYDRVGDVRGQPYAASLGDLAGAMESYLKALQIREEIVSASPKDVQGRRDLAGSYRRIGTQLIEINETPRGLEYLRKALAVCLELVSEQPASDELRYELSAAYNDLGLAMEDGDVSKAVENHRKALALREKFVAADPGNQTHRRNLSVSYVNLGRVLFLNNDMKGGLESNRRGLVIRASLFAENPSNADYRRLLAVSYQNDGDYRGYLRDVVGALDSFRKKLVLDEQALADDPLNARARGDLAYSYEKMGELSAVSRDYSQALSFHRKALAIYEKGTADAPQDLHVRYRAMLNRANVAEIQAKLGRQALALTECSKAIAMLEDIPEDPTSIRHSTARGEVYTRLAQTYVSLAASRNATATKQWERWHAARNMYAQSLKIYQDMQQRGFLTGADTAKPQEVAREIARCHAHLRRSSGAVLGTGVSQPAQ